MRFLMNCWLHFWGTLTHKFWVWIEIGKVIRELRMRALIHDFTKFDPDERQGFIRVIHKLRGSTYGSEEYRKTLVEIKPAIDAHYRKNPHHPEFHGGRTDHMDIYDLIEMVCDWKASIRRHADGDIEKSWAVNRTRFKISSELEKILRTL